MARRLTWSRRSNANIESTYPLLLDSVTFGYEPHVATVSDITGRFAPGRICALIGPNAAGKSTLLRLMLGQLRPWSGSIKLAGVEVGELDERQRAAVVGYVPQQGQVSFAFTVEQVIAMGRFALGRSDAAVDRAIEQCYLQPLRRRIFSRLSAGQQQRVMLARAMAQGDATGQAMLLDEPVSAMDLRHVHQTMVWLGQLRDRGLAIVVVLHDLNLATRYADDVWLLHEGRLAAAGAWQAVLTSTILEPVYGVKLSTVAHKGDERPVFIVDDVATISNSECGLSSAAIDEPG